MAMPVTVPRYTLEDLESFPDDGNRYELLAGVLLVTPLAEFPHQRAASRLLAELVAYLRPDRIAEVFSPGCVEREPNLHLEPDLLVVPARATPRRTGDARWRDLQEYWLAVEVSGVESRVYDRDHKGPAYLAVGVREFWRVDLADRCLYTSRPGGPAEVAHSDRVSWLAPGRQEPLVIVVPELFA